jgi:lambda repressor-like predicted transcriptional regulator
MRAPGSYQGREFVSLSEEERMQMNGSGPIQRSATQWSEIIARYRQSGLSSRQFCEQEGLTPRTLAKWERRLRRGESRQGTFIAVPAPGGGSEPWAVEVEFPTGVRLRVRG